MKTLSINQLLISSLVAIGLTIVISGCSDTEKNYVANPFSKVLVIQDSVTHVSSYGGSDGAIEIILEGGEPPFHIFWEHLGDSTRRIESLMAGDYTVNVAYGGYGVASKTITVKEPDPYNLNIDYDITDVSKYGGSDGSIALSVSGGEEPYSYIWTGSQLEKPQMTQNLEEIPAGDYKVVITDSNPYKPVKDSTVVTVTQPEFTCGRDSITDINGNKYSTVQIGDQCWTGENLKVEDTPEGEEIDGRFCYEDYCEGEKGSHYTWNSVMNGATPASSEEPYKVIQGICPDGWHVPTKAEWSDLENYLGVDGNGGSGTWAAPKLRGENSSSGFDALITGNWGYTIFEEDVAVFWTANEDPGNSKNARYRLIEQSSFFFYSGTADKRKGVSVRCIKDKEEE
jgi:uncharacterized protein (TIGR02145 family)